MTEYQRRESLNVGYETWCVHFRGLQHDVCAAGVRYADVHGDGVGTDRYPCFRDSTCGETCPERRFPTAQEIAAEKRRLDDAIRQFQDRLANHECPHCGRPLTRKVQVGRCVYGEPCGHRLYQGRLR